jgi:hypothetical protein
LGKTYFAKTTLNLVKLKTISKQSGVKISAIFLSLFVSSLRKTLIKLGKDWDNKVGNDGAIMNPLTYPAIHPAEKGKFGSYA